MDLISKLPEKWQKLFMHKDVKPTLDACLEKLKTKDHEKIENNALLRPKYDEIFRAFSYFDIDDLKVIIIGQDPYPKIEDACGLSFALRDGKTKHSLAAIYECLSVSGFSNCDITKWPSLGVLLLNKYLTRTATVVNGVVENGGSDKEHMHTFWGDFTNIIIRKIVNYKHRHGEKITIMMWGDKAKIEGLTDKSHNLYWGHPSKLSNYNKTDNPKNFKYCDHFTITHKLHNIPWGVVTAPKEAEGRLGGPCLENSKETKETTKKENKKIIVFTDGGCSNNGKKNAVASYGVYFPDAFMDNENAMKGKFGGKVPSPPTPTNNRGELLGMITALEKIVEFGAPVPILLITDSTYCMKTVKEWMPKWFKKNPTFSDRPNSDLLLRLLDNLIKLENLHGAKHPTFLTIEHQNSHLKAPPKDPKVKTGGHAYESHLGNSVVDQICTGFL